MGATLTEQVRRLLDDCRAAGLGDDSTERLRTAAERLDEPLRVAIVGKVKAGKSTLLNALVGERLAPTDATECTRIVTWYREGMTYRVTMTPRNGLPRQARFEREDGALDVDLDGLAPEEVLHLDVEWPSSALHDMTLIDTPGLASLSAGLSEQTELLLVPEDEGPGEADAVLYLMRHLHADDSRFLEAFHDGTAQGTPANAIGVISRADEVAPGRLDALESAARIAARYNADPQILRWCQTVVPVAGLLAQAGTVLTEEEFRALRTLAESPAGDVERMLLTADRFLDSEASIALTPEQRTALSRRLGLFGVRLSVTLLRDDPEMTSARLARELASRSGIDQLRDLLHTQFAAPADALKARSALAAARAALESANVAVPDRERLLAEAERIESSAHVFAEMQLLNALRTGAVPFGAEEREDAERLLGASGRSAAQRLALTADADPESQHAAITAAIQRWQQRAENPMSSLEQTSAARVVVRSCEGVLADLSAPTGALQRS
jgi:hypothetical protein